MTSHRDSWSVRAAILTVAACTVLSSLISPASAQANAFEALGPDEQKAVLEELKTRLPELLPENDERAVTLGLRALASQDVGKLARIAGQASTGEYREAASQVAALARDELRQSVEAELDRLVANGESPIAQGAYDFLKRHPDLAVTVARDLLSGEWEKARDALWQTATEEGPAWIRETSEQTLINAYNWVFNAQTRTIAGTPISPAHALIYTAKLEMEILGKWRRQLPIETMEKWYALYREVGWQGFYDQALVDQQAYGGSGAHGRVEGHGDLWGTRPEDLKELFTTCNKPLVESCLEERVDRARAEQKRAERTLRAAAEAEEEALRERLDAIQQAKEQLAREESPEFAQKMKDAREIADKIETAAGAVAGHCETFYEALGRMESAEAAARDAEAAVQVVERAIDERALCREMDDHRQGLTGDLQILNDRKSAFDRALKEAEAASGEACAAAVEVSGAGDKRRGRTPLDEATRRGTELGEAVQRAEALANRIRAENETLDTVVTEVVEDLEEARELARVSSETEAAFAAIEAAAGAEEVFDSARADMEAAAIKAQGLAQVVEQVNPIDLGYIASAAEALEGSTNRVENTRIFQLLSDYSSAPEVKDLLDDVRDQLATLRPPACVRKWSSEKDAEWQAPTIPEDLVRRAAEAREACQDLPDPEAFESIRREAAQIAADMEAEEVGLWVHQREGERCVADAAQAFAALPDPAAALEAAVSGLESLCAEAEAHEAAAQDASRKARETSGRLANALGDLAPPASANDALSACSRLAEIKNGVIQSSELAKSKAAEARRAASSATSALTTCSSPGDLTAADGAGRAARAAVREALSAHARAEEGDDLFDQITRAAETALSETRQTRDRLDTLSIQEATLRNHVDNLERSREAAKAGFAQCEETRDAVRQQWLAAGGAEDPSLAGFGQRIEAVQTDPGTLPGAGVARTASELVQQIDSAEQRIQEAVTGLTRCAQAESPYPKVLEAKQAILTLDAVTSELDGLAALRTRCENELDSTSATAGATGRDGYDVGKDPDNSSSGGGDGDQPGNLGEVDGAIEGGQVTPEPGYGEGGRGGYPTPGPPEGSTDGGFEEPPGDADDPGRRAVDPSDPEIVEQGTSGGDLPDDRGTGSGRSPRDPSGRDRERDDRERRGREGPSRDDSVPGGGTGADAEDGATTVPGGSGGPGPDSGGDTGDGDTSPTDGCCGSGDSGGGSDDSGDGTESGDSGSEPSIGCEEALNEWIAFTQRFEAEIRAHAGDDEDDEDCQWFIDLDREMLRLVERYERDCGRPVENKEIIQQQIDELRAICGGGSGGSSESGDDSPEKWMVWLHPDDTTCCPNDHDGETQYRYHGTRAESARDGHIEVRTFSSKEAMKEWVCSHEISSHYWAGTYAFIAGYHVTDVPCPVTK